LTAIHRGRFEAWAQGAVLTCARQRKSRQVASFDTDSKREALLQQSAEHAIQFGHRHSSRGDGLHIEAIARRPVPTPDHLKRMHVVGGRDQLPQREVLEDQTTAGACIPCGVICA
jgi:hypothetical protein